MIRPLADKESFALHRLLCVLLLLVLGLSTAQALDIAGVITLKGSMGSPFESTEASNLTWNQDERLLLIISHEFTKDMAVVFNGYYQLALSGTGVSGPTVTHTLDFNDLYFSYAINDPFGPQSKFALNAGRSFFYDFTAQVLAQKLDGIQMVVDAGGLNGLLAIGTTAGLFKEGNSILLNSKDLSDFSDDLQCLARPRLIALLDIKSADLLPGQTLGASVIGLLDLSPVKASVGDVASLANGVPVQALWIGLGMNGKILPGLFYNVAAYLQSGSTLNQDASAAAILAGFADFGISYFYKPLLNSRFSLGASYSTGDSDAIPGLPLAEASSDPINSSFSGITKRGGGYIYSAQHGNALVAKAAWSFKPLRTKPGGMDLMTALDLQSIFRLGNAIMAEPLIAGTTQNYIGSEIDISANFRPMSDLSFALKTGIFLANGLAIEKQSSWKAGLDISLSL